MQSKKYKKTVLVILVIVVILIIFNLGMRVGYLKASFANEAGDNYYRPLLGGMPMEQIGFFHDMGIGAHGVNGKIISINLPTIIVADEDSTEKVVRIEDETVIRKLRDTIPAQDLQAGDFIVVIGRPKAGAEIDAQFIRVMPAVPTPTK